jgi:murein endopeptidase
VAAGLAVGCGGGEDVRAVRPLQIEQPPAVAKDWRGREGDRAARVEGPVREVAPRRRASRAVGRPHDGRLEHGVQLAPTGRDWLTWDPIYHRIPNRGERVWGTDVLVRTVQRVLAEYRAANPGAPRVLVGDLSRPRGGIFDRRFGGLGHASHQNGLDVDLYYPRTDGREGEAFRPAQVDRALSQDLVDRFVAAGARFVFVGIEIDLEGPEGVVQSLPHHDNHVHVRIANPRR